MFFSAGAFAQSEDSGDANIVILSDLNESYGSTHYGEHVKSALGFIEKTQPDMVLCTGDMVAGQSKDLSDSDIKAMWDSFEQTIRRPLEELGIPFAFTIGNHDGSASGSFDNERYIAEEYWKRNKPPVDFVSDSRYPFLYSFVFDDLFILVWDASYQSISEQDLMFVESELQSDIAKSAGQRIVMGHLPLYAVARGRNRRGEILSGADSLLQVFEKSSVDLYLSGHHHAWYPAEKNGVKLLAMGAQGSGPRQLIGSDIPARRTITRLLFSAETNSLKIQTFDMENSLEEVRLHDLPLSIKGVNGRIFRLEQK